MTTTKARAPATVTRKDHAWKAAADALAASRAEQAPLVAAEQAAYDEASAARTAYGMCRAPFCGNGTNCSTHPTVASMEDPW